MIKNSLSINRKADLDNVVTSFLEMISPLRENIERIYLFGSRCRDDWHPASDYDILIVLLKKDRQIISRFYDAVIDLLVDTGRVVSLKIFSVEEFNYLKSIPTPFIGNVIMEGVELGFHN